MKKSVKCIILKEPLLAAVYGYLLFWSFADYSMSCNHYSISSSVGNLENATTYLPSVIAYPLFIVFLAVMVSLVVKSWLGSVVGIAAAVGITVFILGKTDNVSEFLSSCFDSKLSTSQMFTLLALLAISVIGLVVNIIRAASKSKNT